jgi:hypothetical protein
MTPLALDEKPMSAVPYEYSSYQPHASKRSRVTSFVLAFGAAALIVLMLIKMGALTMPTDKNKPVVLQLLQNSRAPTPDKKPAKTQHASRAAPHVIAKAQPTPKPTTVEKTPHVPLPWNVTPLSQDEFASSDISNKPMRQPDAQSTGTGTNGNETGKDSVAAYGPGEGPGGEQLFNAEWYTKPTHAELAFYLPKDGPSEGWAMIACRTIENYHVDNCRELGETPGSGLARALRQAAWQFRVRPPRMGGKPLIGAWVRIRFDFTPNAVE